MILHKILKAFNSDSRAGAYIAYYDGEYSLDMLVGGFSVEIDITEEEANYLHDTEKLDIRYFSDAKE